MSVGELVVSIIGDMKALSKAFDEINKEIGGVATTFQTVGAKMSSAGSTLTKSITVPIAAVTAGLGVAANEAMDFESGMAEVFTLLPDLSEESMSGMEQDMLDFSTEMGVMTDEAVPALYQAISAGVPKDNVFDFLTVAQMAALGGVTELETAVDGITSVVNAYGSDVIDATEASDLMFTAVKLGKTTFEELSSSLYNVLQYASSAGVAFGDVTAAISTITSQGTPTAQATTQIRQMLIELSDAGSTVGKTFQEVAGVSFEEFIAQGHNTQEALQLLESYANQTGVGVDELFSSVEAGGAALSLTGSATEKFTSDLQAMQESEGATETAYNRMSETSSHALDEIKASINAIVIELGNNFLPILSDTLVPLVQDTLLPFLSDVVLPVLTTMLQLFGDLPQPVQLLILGLTGLLTALGPILMVVGPMVSAFGELITLLNPIGLAIAAVAVAVYLLASHWDEVGPKIIDAFENIKARVMPLIQTLIDFATGQFQKVGDWWGENGGLIMDAIQVIYDTVVPIVTFLVDLVMSVVEETLPYILDVLDSSINIVLDMIKLFAQVLTGDWEGAWETVKDILSNALDVVESTLKGVLTAVGTILIKIWNKITGFSLYKAGKALINTLKDGILSSLEGATDDVEDWLSDLKEYLPNSPAKKGPFKELPNWDAVFANPVEESMSAMKSTALIGLQTVAGTLQTSAQQSVTNNTYGGNEFTIQSVNLSSDYPFEKFARDMEQYNRQKRIRKGIPS